MDMNGELFLILLNRVNGAVNVLGIMEIILKNIFKRLSRFLIGKRQNGLVENIRIQIQKYRFYVSIIISSGFALMILKLDIGVLDVLTIVMILFINQRNFLLS